MTGKKAPANFQRMAPNSIRTSRSNPVTGSPFILAVAAITKPRFPAQHCSLQTCNQTWLDLIVPFMAQACAVLAPSHRAKAHASVNLWATGEVARRLNSDSKNQHARLVQHWLEFLEPSVGRMTWPLIDLHLVRLTGSQIRTAKCFC